MWKVIHNMTYFYEYHSDKSEQYYDYIIDFLENMHKIMDCSKCKNDYTEYIKTNNPRNSDNIFKWGVEFHNKVNKKLNKPIISLQEAIEIYKWVFL